MSKNISPDSKLPLTPQRVVEGRMSVEFSQSPQSIGRRSKLAVGPGPKIPKDLRDLTKRKWLQLQR